MTLVANNSQLQLRRAVECVSSSGLRETRTETTTISTSANFSDHFFWPHPGSHSHGSHGSHGHSHGSSAGSHDGPSCPPDPHPVKIEYRSFDGSQNNRSDATLNAAGTEFGRIGTAHFADGISVPLGGNNPRTISNLVVGAGDADVANPEGVSAFMYAWGQFIDHDMTLTRTDGVNDISVVVPAGDPVFPAGTIIPITRAVIDPTTGAGHIQSGDGGQFQLPPGSTPRWSTGRARRPPPACAPPTAT